MTLVRPSIQEKILIDLYRLDSSAYKYYRDVVILGRRLFKTMGEEELLVELDGLIKKKIEEPYKSKFINMIDAYYNLKYLHLKNAYVKVGDAVDYREVTRYEMEQVFEEIAEWIFDKVDEMSVGIRLTSPTQIYG